MDAAKNGLRDELFSRKKIIYQKDSQLHTLFAQCSTKFFCMLLFLNIVFDILILL
jgi:hypothetical protein